MKLPGLAGCMGMAALLLSVAGSGFPWELAGVVLLILSLFRKSWRPWMISFLCCLFWGQWMLTPGSADLRTRLPQQPQSIRLRFESRGDSETLEFGEGETERRTPVRATHFYRSGGWQICEARIQLRDSGQERAGLLPGTVWEAAGVLFPERASYTGLKSSEWTFYPDPGSLTRVEQPGDNLFLSSLFQFRAGLAEALVEQFPDAPEVAATLQALLLGRRSELDAETEDRFVKTGLIHVFAVSGLHLGLLAGLLVWGLRRMGLSSRWHFGAVLPLLFVFCLYTGLRASALRAFIMIACLLCAAPFSRRPHIGSAFALAVFLILFLSPTQITDLGFQYSFMLVGGLLAFGRLFSNQMNAWLAPDPWRVETRLSRFSGKVIRPKVTGAVLVTVICFGLSAPLTAYTFNLFTPIGLIGNLLAVPLVFLLLATGFPALVTLGMPEGIRQAAFFPAGTFASWLVDWVDGLQAVPGGYQWVKAPPLWSVVAFYLILAAGWKWPERRRWLLSGCLCLLCFWGSTAWLDPRIPQVGILNADRGQALWLKLPGEGVVMVDAGSAWKGRQIARQLREQGIDRIDTLFLTHPDRNHVGGLSDLLETYTPERIRIAAADLEHPLYRELGRTCQGLSAGERLNAGGWTVEVLEPAANNRHRNADKRSLVLRFSRGFLSVLCMGGADVETESRLLESGVPLSSRILMAGHPGSRDTLSEAFLSAVRPELVVFSGLGFTGKSPGRQRAEERVAYSGIPMLRTDSVPELILKPRQGTLPITKTFEH